MATRPAEALLGLLDELGREEALRPRSRAEALEPRNPDRPDRERSDAPDRPEGNKLEASELDTHLAARSDGLSMEAVPEHHSLDQPGHCQATRYKLANLSPSIPPMTGLHTRMPYRAG